VAGPGKEKMRGKWRAGGAFRSAESARIGLPIEAAKKCLAPAYAKLRRAIYAALQRRLERAMGIEPTTLSLGS
jgi:hypothetical protein